jgi:hypothetical protein
MEQNSAIDRIKTWLDTQTPLVRGLALTGMLVVAGIVLVAIVSLIAGWNTARQLSDALFYVSSIMFALALVFYFGARGGSPQASEEDDDADGAKDRDSVASMMRRRRRDVPFYSVTFIGAGIVLFLLSIALWEVLKT